MKHDSVDDTNCKWRTWNNHHCIGKRTGRLENKSTSRDYSYGSNTEIGQNTDKSAGVLRRFPVTLSPVKTNQPTLVLKILKGV